MDSDTAALVAKVILEELGPAEAAYFIARKVEQETEAGHFSRASIWRRVFRALSKVLND